MPRAGKLNTTTRKKFSIVPPRKAAVGQRYGWLTIAGLAERRNDGRQQWMCRCDCGAEVIAPAHLLYAGKKKSCGCWRKKIPNGKTHGASAMSGRRKDNPLWCAYIAWTRMRERCSRPSSSDYHYYGGRGIMVCERWATFENFLADMGLPDFGLTLDRKDTNGNYCKENCRWATRAEQSRNRRSNVFYEFHGRRQTAAEWARELGISHVTLFMRMKRGWSIDRALATTGNAHMRSYSAA